MMTSDLHGPWSAIRRSPMLRLALPTITGMLLAWGFAPRLGPALVVLGIFTISAAVVLSLPNLPLERWHRGAVQFGWFLSLGLCWHAMRSPEHDPFGIEKAGELQGPWIGRVSAINSSGERVVGCDITLVAERSNGSLEPVRGQVLSTLMRTTDGVIPIVGDLLLVDADVQRIERRPDPGGFDRTRWAASRGIHHELFARSESWRIIGHRTMWFDVFRDARIRISTWLNGSELRVRERALVKALVLGEREELESDQRDAFLKSGTIHVLAVSGMHVGLIYIILTRLFGWWGKGRNARWARGILILLVLWGYTGLTGASPSVLRAAVMFSLFTVAGMGRQQTDNLNNLFAAALILLVWDPMMLQQAGFQLSFLAVLGIILFYRPIQRLWVSRWWLLREGWSLAALSIAAQLLTTPVSLELFKAFPVWFLPANLVVVTASSFAVYGGILLIILYKLPVIGVALTWAMTMLLRFVDLSTNFFASLPGSYPAVRVELFDMIVLYVWTLSLGAWLGWRWRGAWYCALLTTAMLFGTWAWRSEARISQDTFIVYDQRQGFVAGMLHGRELVVAASADSILGSRYTTAKLERHQRASGIKTIIPMEGGLDAEEAGSWGHTVAGGGRWRSAHFNILFVSDDPTSARPAATIYDAIVLHDIYRLDENTLHLLRSTPYVVIAGGVSVSVRRKLRTLADAGQIRPYDVARQGAFILEK